MKRITAILAALIVAASVSAKTENKLFENLYASAEGKETLFRVGSAAQWLPYPAYSDRAGWDAFLTSARKKAMIEEAEKELDYEWQTLYASDYLLYEQTGDRGIMKKEIRNRAVLHHLILGELAEGKGRFLPKIADGMWFETQRHSWDHAQHTTRQSSRRTLPGYDEKFITLHSAVNASTLAMAFHFFKEELDKMEPTICQTVYRALEEHTFKPFLDESLDDRAHAFFGFKDKGQIINNWDPYCCIYTTLAYMLVDRDQERLDRAMQRSSQAIDAYLSYITQDGACDEGPSYWRMAFGKIYEYARLISDATAGRVNALGDPFLRRMGEFKMKTDLGDNWVMDYGDAEPRAFEGTQMLLYRFADGIGSEQLKDYALTKFVDAKKNRFRSFKSYTSEIYTALEDLRFEKQLLGDFKTVEARESDLSAFVSKVEQGIQSEWYAETQQAVIRNGRGWVLAAKGGHNGESHNHNDTGSGMLFINGIPVLIDPGTGTYVKATFSKDRYTLWHIGSYAHNVPILGSSAQKDGKEYGSSMAECDLGAGTFRTEFAGAYGPESGFSRLERSWTLEQDRLTLVDSWTRTAAKGNLAENFLTNATIRQPGEKLGEYKVRKGELGLECRSFDGKRKVNVVMQYPSGYSLAVLPHDLDDKRLSSAWGPFVYRVIFSRKGQDPAKGSCRVVFTVVE